MDAVAGTSRSKDAAKSASSSAKEKEMIRRFVFTTGGGDDDEGEELIAFVSEVLRPDYGLYTWPCAAVLAQYICHHRRIFKDARALEMGCGTALPGIVAALCGARVTLSDAADQRQCLENCRKSCLANNLSVNETIDNDDGIDDSTRQVNLITLTWGKFEPNLLEVNGLDFLLASDCFYDPKDFEDIIVTISFILDRNAKCKCLCTYQVRSSDWTIEPLLSQWKLNCKHIPVSSFNADCAELGQSNLPGSHAIQMLEFTRKTSS